MRVMCQVIVFFISFIFFLPIPYFHFKPDSPLFILFLLCSIFSSLFSNFVAHQKNCSFFFSTKLRLIIRLFHLQVTILAHSFPTYHLYTPSSPTNFDFSRGVAFLSFPKTISDLLWQHNFIALLSISSLLCNNQLWNKRMELSPWRHGTKDGDWYKEQNTPHPTNQS